tara:strand:- start:857 stop:1651 length:795 start_codon:yes stop_codon:yes gene_type:complete
MQCCLLSLHLEQAIRVLKAPLFDFTSKNTGLTRVDVMRFFYYAGMVLTSLEQYDKAIEYFSQCITIPRRPVSQIAIQAYKKAVLVQILIDGTVYEAPRQSSGQIESHCDAYLALAKAVSECDAQSFDNIVEDQASFARDGNAELAAKCRSVVSLNLVRRLAMTYSNLSIDAIVKKTGLGNAEEVMHLLGRMSNEGKISFKVDKSAQTVDFGGIDSSDYAISQLMKTLTNVVGAYEAIVDIDERVCTSEEYATARDAAQNKRPKV